MKCSCGQKAVARWDLHVCADGGRKRVLRLCQQCDYRLNQHILTLLSDPHVGEKMKRYSQRSEQT